MRRRWGGIVGVGAPGAAGIAGPEIESRRLTSSSGFGSAKKRRSGILSQARTRRRFVGGVAFVALELASPDDRPVT